MELSYRIRRSARRKTLTITVERDRTVVVHAPHDTPDEKIREIVESKRQWIYGKLHHRQKYDSLPHPPGKELVSGESALFLGRPYRIEVIPTGHDNIQFDGIFLIPAVAATRRFRLLRNWYISRAKDIIVPRAEKHATALGVDVAAIKIVDSRYRWGSCTTNDNITINWRLIKAPMFVVDYVVVHELTHLLEPNHTARFWNIVRSSAPTMEKAKSWLKENGHHLEEAL